MQNSEGAFASPIEVEERENFSLPPPIAEVQISISSIQAACHMSSCLALRGLSIKARGSRTPAHEMQGVSVGPDTLGKASVVEGFLLYRLLQAGRCPFPLRLCKRQWL